MLSEEITMDPELLSKDVELNVLPVAVFIFFLSCLVYPGDKGPIIVCHLAVQCTLLHANFYAKYSRVARRSRLI